MSIGCGEKESPRRGTEYWSRLKTQVAEMIHPSDKSVRRNRFLQKLVVLRMGTDPEPHDIFTVHSAQGALPEADPRRVAGLDFECSS
jgi:hypothetical protein